MHVLIYYKGQVETPDTAGRGHELESLCRVIDHVAVHCVSLMIIRMPSVLPWGCLNYV